MRKILPFILADIAFRSSVPIVRPITNVVLKLKNHSGRNPQMFLSGPFDDGIFRIFTAASCIEELMLPIPPDEGRGFFR